jgi:heme/copper-type cytochrome/quinol oxidase subunit 3
MATRVAQPTKQPATEAAQLRRALPNGWWGMLMLVASEATLFATLIASYFYLRFENVHWPPPGYPRPDVVVPIVLCAVLVATTLPMLAAQRAVRRGRLGTTRAALVLALVVQSGYLAMQLHRLVDDTRRFSASGHAYGSIYYTLIGSHHAHVAVGILLDLWLLWKLRGGLTSYRLVAVQAVTLYWVGINALAIAVTATILSAA